MIFLMFDPLNMDIQALEASEGAVSDYRIYVDRLQQNRSIDLRVDKNYDPLSNKVNTDLAE